MRWSLGVSHSADSYFGVSRRYQVGWVRSANLGRFMCPNAGPSFALPTIIFTVHTGFCQRRDWLHGTSRVPGHTHLDQSLVDKDAALKIVTRHLGFLARKLIGDLEAGEKAFVYMMAGSELPLVLIHRIHDAIASYGPGRLVVVNERAADEPVFDVNKIRPGMPLDHQESTSPGGGHVQS
jgi:hypothetical protein